MHQNYRNTDLKTSELAGKAVTHSGKRITNMMIVIGAVREHPGHTSAELAKIMDDVRLDRYEFARRLSDAYREHKVKHGIARECRVTNRLCITWEIE